MNDNKYSLEMFLNILEIHFKKDMIKGLKKDEFIENLKSLILDIEQKFKEDSEYEMVSIIFRGD